LNIFIYIYIRERFHSQVCSGCFRPENWHLLFDSRLDVRKKIFEFIPNESRREPRRPAECTPKSRFKFSLDRCIPRRGIALLMFYRPPPAQTRSHVVLFPTGHLFCLFACFLAILIFGHALCSSVVVKSTIQRGEMRCMVIIINCVCYLADDWRCLKCDPAPIQHLVQLLAGATGAKELVCTSPACATLRVICTCVVHACCTPAFPFRVKRNEGYRLFMEEKGCKGAPLVSITVAAS
jgi:hypothetical protein